MVCSLLVGSALSWAAFAPVSGQALPEGGIRWLDLSPTAFPIFPQAIIFLLGWPLEWTELIVIFVPTFLLDHFSA
jgi:TRAP-type mannitol/chloroaromatic compound transport system permease large subunit